MCSSKRNENDEADECYAEDDSLYSHSLMFSVLWVIVNRMLRSHKTLCLAIVRW